MLARELRQLYIDFFKDKGHLHLPGAPVIPRDILGREDRSTLFTSAGMQQFKPYFTGEADPPCSRIVTIQKCVRTGDIDSVGDFSHCTFFEMLGNFSFGDYFKAEVIPWTWEFLIDRLGIDPDRICVTVYKDDDEAYDIWHKVIGLPEDRVHRMDEDKNYWPANAISEGPDGPCGPCSEIFYRVAPLEEMTTDPKLTSTERYKIDDDAGRWLEIWNNVFTQFNRSTDEGGKPVLTPLPKKNNDTGGGFDRVARVIQGKNSVFETDLFSPILEQIEKLSGKAYTGTAGPQDFAFRVVAEHTRCMVFCIGDDILPSNEGRGYVLRRIMRRAIRFGKTALGFDEPFLHEIAPKVIEQMGDFYPEIVERQEHILRTILSEEERFRTTLDNGSQRLGEMLETLEASGSKVLEGSDAFLLYDTFGFPLELTKEIAAECYIVVDEEGFQKAMLEQRERSRKVGSHGAAVFTDSGSIGTALSVKKDNEKKIYFVNAQSGAADVVNTQRETVGEFLTDNMGSGFDADKYLIRHNGKRHDSTQQTIQNGDIISVSLTKIEGHSEDGIDSAISSTEFVGYDQVDIETSVVRIETPKGITADILETAMPGDRVAVTLRQSPFYAESGGQIGDKGWLSWPAGGTACALRAEVLNTTKGGQLIRHDVLVHEGELHWGQQVRASVDVQRRRHIMRNHTATHLLHAALRTILGTHVHQKGSLVAPDRLRFDFTHTQPVLPDELRRIEEMVNDHILADYVVKTHQDIPISEAKSRGAMALFGEKYGDKVRMVEIPGFSLELCGGTHLSHTSQVGLFKIVSETGVSSGVRRIEAVTGAGAYKYVNDQEERLGQVAAALKSNTRDVLTAAERLQSQRSQLEKQVQQLKAGAAAESGSLHEQVVSGVLVVTGIVQDADGDTLSAIADRTANEKRSAVIVLGGTTNGKVSFASKVTPDLIKLGFHAGNLIREVAKAAGGGGGGRPDFAQAGGRDSSKIGAAMEIVAELVVAQAKQSKN